MDTLLPVLQNILTPQGGWSLAFLVRIVLSVLLLYALVVMIARAFGARTFASFTSFDFLINVAAGSLVASSIMGRNLAEGALALLCLAAVQWLVSSLSARSRRFHDVVDNPPVVLIEHGRYQERAMRRARISQQSLDQKLRSQGVGDVGEVRFAILESGGNVSVMTGEGEERPGTFPRRAG
ncbi:DUF421 domain-containing protein [Deinococcus budaensis]|uniref:Uncharacterized membrane protein YcaP (DUF421 family) n=1 Tax=Deinococcus budaensis TaxID=1665626 RepID=A0A7W8GG86_9DEIO|nr:YetF domain-containing protein [Deinococcus budaensis]MBB5234653.1 uncharacterized membrane protein YcaP (DUF421 family) [Deinococcus budaensis]